MNLRSLLLFVALLPSALFSQPTATPTPPPAPAPAWTTTRDAFLSFALDKAKSYSGAAEQAVNKAVDVAATEAPIVFKEWVTWRIWYHALHCTIPLLFIGFFALVGCRGGWDDGGEPTPQNVRKVVGYVLCGISCVFAFCSLLITDPPAVRAADREQGHLYSLIQVCAAPRVYTIEQVGRLFGK